MLERLWNGWRATYVTSGGAAGGVGADDVESGRGSVFTRILHSGLPDADTHIVHRGDARASPSSTPSRTPSGTRSCCRTARSASSRS